MPVPSGKKWEEWVENIEEFSGPLKSPTV